MAIYGTNTNHANDDWKKAAVSLSTPKGEAASSLQAMGNTTGTTTGNGYSFAGTAGDAARFMAPVARPAATPQDLGPYRVTSGSDFAKKETPSGPVMLGPESGLGWKTRLAKYQSDAETLRNASSNASALARENLSQEGQTGRQKSGELAQMSLQGQRIGADFGLQEQRGGMESGLQQKRIDAANSLAGLQHKYDLEKLSEGDKFKAAEQNRLIGAQALLAGGDESVASNLLNTAPGFPGSAKGLNIPLKNNQVDQYQFITQDNGAGKGQTVLAGNKASGTATPINAAASSLVVGGQGAGQQPQAATQRTQGQGTLPAQNAGQPGAQTPSAAAQQAANAYTKIYQNNPQQLTADANEAHAKLGTVYKNNDDRFRYFRDLEKSNPQLHQELIRRLQGQQSASL
jgi:hypothetical protein